MLESPGCVNAANIAPFLGRGLSSQPTELTAKALFT